MVFTVYCLYCNVSGLVVLLLNKFDLIDCDVTHSSIRSWLVRASLDTSSQAQTTQTRQTC